MNININNCDKLYECNICYEKLNDNQVINLKCCNSTKNICIECLNYLTTPLCPYCRKKMDNSVIPYLNNITNINNSISFSENQYSYFDNNTNYENITYVNPFSYDNTRDLIRQIRNRRLYYKRLDKIETKKNNFPIKSNKKYFKKQLNNIANDYNNNIQDKNDIEEDIFYFEL